MKTYYKLTILLLLCSLCSFAQSGDTLLCVSYEYQQGWTKNEMPEIRVLQMDGEVSRFYSLTERKVQAQLDSLVKVMNGDGDRIMGARKLLQQGQKQKAGSKDVVYKHLPSISLMTYTTKIGRQAFLYTDSLIATQWHLEEGDTVIMDYNCAKASLDYRGQRWNVWYSQEIPISDGPWKLSGLPGLILFAQTASGDFSFNANAIYYESGTIDLPNEKDYVRTTRKKVNELKGKLALDPVSVMESLIDPSQYKVIRSKDRKRPKISQDEKKAIPQMEYY